MNIRVDWLPLLPVLIPSLAAVFVLVVDAVVPRRRGIHFLLAVLALGAALVATVPALRQDFDHPVRSLCLVEGGCFYQVDKVSAGLQALSIGSAFVIVLLAAPVRTQKSLSAIQVSAILSVTAGAAGVAAARDLPAWLVLLEIATVPTVLLAAVRARRTAIDGALNLLVTSLLSFAITAMGVALWFAATGAATFSSDVVLQTVQTPADKRILATSLMLILVGVGFKLSLAPFHLWTPEAYAGSSTPMTAVLATVSKIAALGALLAVGRSLAVVGGATLVTVGVLAALSMTVGNVMALRENNTLRFMAWSSVSQAGWVLLPLATASSAAITAAASYLAVYVVATLAVFVSLTAIAHRQGRAAMTSFEGLAGLGRRQPWAGAVFALGLLTLAGLPPAIGGLLAKVAALKPIAAQHQWVLLVVAAVNAMIGVAAYLRWVWQTFSPAEDATPARELRSHPLHQAMLVVALPALVVVSLAPQFLFGLVS